MAIISTFYDTSAGVPASLVTEVKWAKAHPYIGSSTYGVVGGNDFKVTAHPTTAQAVNVSTGRAWGWGVLDDSSTIVTKVASAPAAGTSRWDLVCIRRNWTLGAGGPSTIEIVEGGTTKALPAGRNTTPGTIDDQPLALVQWTAGQTQPSAMVDLRCWAGNGGMTAVDELVLTYLDSPGAAISIQGSTWYAGVGLNGTISWGKAFSTGKVPLFGNAGNTYGGNQPDRTDFLMQAGTSVNYSDFTGYSRISWPKRFPNGVLSVILTNGDSWATGTAVWFAVEGNNPFWGPSGGGGRDDVVYTCWGWRDGQIRLMPNMLHRVNWIAIGW